MIYANEFDGNTLMPPGDVCVCVCAWAWVCVCVWVCVSVSEWTGSSVVQMMACCLFDTKPLHESLLNFFIWNHMINSSKMWIKIQIFSNAKYSIFCIRQYLYFDPHFARNSIWLKTLSAKWMPFSSNRIYYKQLPTDWLSILNKLLKPDFAQEKIRFMAFIMLINDLNLYWKCVQQMPHYICWTCCLCDTFLCLYLNPC